MMNNRRQEDLTDAGPEVSLVLRKTKGIPVRCLVFRTACSVGSPSDVPACIFSLQALIYVPSISITQGTKRRRGYAFDVAALLERM